MRRSPHIGQQTLSLPRKNIEKSASSVVVVRVLTDPDVADWLARAYGVNAVGDDGWIEVIIGGWKSRRVADAAAAAALSHLQAADLEAVVMHLTL